MGNYLNLKPHIVKILLSEPRLRRSINIKEKSDPLIKVSQEFYDAISAAVCQKSKYYSLLLLKKYNTQQCGFIFIKKKFKT